MNESTACWSQQLGLALFSKALCSNAGVALTVMLVCAMLLIYVAKRIRPRTHLPPGSTDSSIRVISQLLKGLCCTVYSISNANLGSLNDSNDNSPLRKVNLFYICSNKFDPPELI